jgi:Nod factor-specific ABC transporter NodJ protein
LRNLLVWRKLAIPSLVANIAEPLMWLVAFGYGLGALVGEVTLGEEKVPYILFLASGSICMSAMNAATFEALYSAFSRMHVQKTWDGILNAPMRLDDVLLAEMLWAAFKALFTITAILGVMFALGITQSWKLLAAWPILLCVGITFSCIALIFNALAKGYDFFTYYFTLFTHDVLERRVFPTRSATGHRARHLSVAAPNPSHRPRAAFVPRPVACQPSPALRRVGGLCTCRLEDCPAPNEETLQSLKRG